MSKVMLVPVDRKLSANQTMAIIESLEGRFPGMAIEILPGVHGSIVVMDLPGEPPVPTIH